jgi:hypothetical protein
LGLGCGSWFTFSASQIDSDHVEIVIVIVQVFIFWVVDGIHRFGILVFVHQVNSGPVHLALGVVAGFVFLNLFPTFFLAMSLLFAEIAEFVVPIGFASIFCATSG